MRWAFFICTALVGRIHDALPRPLPPPVVSNVSWAEPDAGPDASPPWAAVTSDPEGACVVENGRVTDELAAGFHRCGWPARWSFEPARKEARLRELATAGARFFEIGSDIGLEGWVVASGFDYVEQPPA